MKSKILLFLLVTLFLFEGQTLAQVTTEREVITIEKEMPKIDCNCQSIKSTRDCKRRTIRYYIDLPENCKPITMSMIDATTARALWDRVI